MGLVLALDGTRLQAAECHQTTLHIDQNFNFGTLFPSRRLPLGSN